MAISRRAFADGATRVYLARADVFADALAAGVLVDGPILLVPSCSAVPTAVTDEVNRLGADEVVALGGQAAVCDSVLTDVAGSRTTDRVAGSSRYATAVAISQRAFPGGAEDVFLARADDSPDAVVGGALTTGPILLLPPTGDLPDVVRAELARLEPNSVVALGGTGAIPESTLEAAADGRATLRLGGNDRFETATIVADHAFPSGSSAAYLARADVFADAVAAGSLADGPVLLVPQCGTLPPSVAATLDALDPHEIIGLGGPGAICDQIVSDAQEYVEPTMHAVVSDTTEPLSEAQRASMREYDAADGTVRFDQDTDLTGVEVGDVLVSAPTAAAPDGFLRQVTAVEQQGSEWVVTTAPAALSDAVEEASLHHTTRVDGSTIESSDIAIDGVVIEPIGASGRTDGTRTFAGSVSLGGVRVGTEREVVLHDGDGDADTTDDQIAVDLDARVFLDLTVDWENEGLRIEQVDLIADAGDTVDLSFRVGGAAPLFDEPVERRLGTTRLGRSFLTISGLPVVLSYSIDWDLVYSASVTAEVTGGIRHDGRVTAKATWIRGVDGVATKFTPSSNWAAVSPEVHGGAAVRAGLRATPRIRAYGVAGPSFPIQFYGRAQADVHAGGDGLSGTAGLYAGLDIGAKLETRWEVFPDFPLFADVEVVPEFTLREWTWPEAASASVAILEPGSLSPHRFMERDRAAVLPAIFQGLVDYDPVTNDVVMAAAESITTTDNFSFTVTLREGATFHDGEPVTAASFVDAWNFAADVDNWSGSHPDQSGHSDVGSWFSNIAGSVSVAIDRDGDPMTGMSGLQVTGERTFTVRLLFQDQAFVTRLGQSPYLPLPSSYYADPAAFAEAPIGNGPFMLDGAFEHDVRIPLARFDDYVGPDQPSLSGLELKIFPSSQAQYDALVNGDVDVVASIPSESIDDAAARFDGGFGSAPAPITHFMNFPLTVDWLGDVRLRRALSMAIDRPTAIAGLGGRELPAHAFVPPPIPGHQEVACPNWQHDAQSAAALWEAAGGYDGAIEVWFYEPRRQWVTAIASQWTQTLGLRPDQVVLREVPFVELLEHLEQGTITGPYAIGWGMDYPHPANFLAPLHHSTQAPPTGANYVRYDSPVFDDLLDRALAFTSLDAAIEAYRDAESQLCTDVPDSPVFHPRHHWASSDAVSGVLVDAFGHIDYTALTTNS